MMKMKLRKTLSLVMGVCISVGAWASDDGVKLESETDKTSYALGYQIGGDFQRQRITLNDAAVLRGIVDGRTGTSPLMSEASMRSTLIELKRKVVEHERENMRQADKRADATDAVIPETQEMASPESWGEKSASAASPPAQAQRSAAKTSESAKAFFVKNAQRKDIVSLPSGLQYRVLKDGTGKQPQAADNVALIYRGTFANGNEFGNTEDEGEPGPKIYPLTALVPGLREAISHMKEGAEWQVFVPPELGFNASTPLYRKVTVFDVKLVAINP